MDGFASGGISFGGGSGSGIVLPYRESREQDPKMLANFGTMCLKWSLRRRSLPSNVAFSGPTVIFIAELWRVKFVTGIAGDGWSALRTGKARDFGLVPTFALTANEQRYRVPEVRFAEVT